jgi:hypothetical protein
MEWISVDNTEIMIPFSKVCIYDGGNTFWAYLHKIEITSAGRNLIWQISTPEGYKDCIPTHWMKITYPGYDH